MKGYQKNHSSIVIMYTTEIEICFTRNRVAAIEKGYVSLLWRLIGGRKKENQLANEAAEKTAIREAFQESGKTLEEADLFYIRTINKKNHDKFIFSAPVDTLDDIRPEPGKIGAEVAAFNLGYIESHRSHFHPDHLLYLEMACLIKVRIKEPELVKTI